jgi:hypothetical protein
MDAYITNFICLTEYRHRHADIACLSSSILDLQHFIQHSDLDSCAVSCMTICYGLTEAFSGVCAHSSAADASNGHTIPQISSISQYL